MPPSIRDTLPIKKVGGEEIEILPIEVFEGRTLKLAHIKDNSLILLFNSDYKLEITPEADIRTTKSGNLNLRKTLNIRASKPKPDPSSSLDEFHN